MWGIRELSDLGVVEVVRMIGMRTERIFELFFRKDIGMEMKIRLVIVMVGNKFRFEFY